jgi:ATP-dependent DNA ligase
MTIKDILDEIAAEGGSNMKMEILRKHAPYPSLRDVLYLANSRRVKFYIKQIPAHSVQPQSLVTLDQAIKGLDVLRNRVVTGHDAQNHLAQLLSDLDEADGTVIKRIINKDLRIGMGTTNINKVFPKLIEETPYMGAKAFSRDLVNKLLASGKALSQMKMDGRYSNSIIRHSEVELESRQGETTYLTGATFIQELSKLPNCVLNGELTMDGLTRYESNGIIASLVSILGKADKGEDILAERHAFLRDYNMSPEDALAHIRYSVWDMISVEEYFDFKSPIPYHQRLKNLEEALSNINPTMISIVESVEVGTYQEAMDHFQTLINQGHEGTILKSSNGAWKDGKPTYNVKLKLEITIDLKITGFRYGTGKNASVISTVECESEDGLLKTAPTGINEKTMKWITENQQNLLGKILEVKCSGVSQNERGEYSTLHPVYNEIRDDKDKADTLQQILDIEAMAKGLK